MQTKYDLREDINCIRAYQKHVGEEKDKPMKQMLYFSLLVIVTFGQIAVCRADIIARYPGIAGLVEQADAIAIVQVGSRAVFDQGEWNDKDRLMKEVKAGKRAYDPRWGSSCGTEPFFASFLSVLKQGVTETSTQTLTRGVIGMTSKPSSVMKQADSEMEAFAQQHSRWLATGEYALVFLRKSSGTINSGNLPFETLNCPGSSIAISKSTAESIVRGKTPLDQVRGVLNAEMKRKDSAVLAAIFLASLR